MKKPCKIQQRNGVATIELALIAPIIVLLIFGSIEFARIMMVRHALTNAARTGSRCACLVTSISDDAPELAVRKALRGVIEDVEETEALRVSCSPAISSSLATGTVIEVTVEVDCSDVSWLPPFFTAGAKIQGTAKMKRE